MIKNPNPTKDQFFLRNREILLKIIQTINASQGENIVEIGGGEGALTDYLIKMNSGKNFITVIEKDPFYANFLKEKYAGLTNVEVLEGDALKYDFSNYDRIVANLPYTITEPFLVNLAKSGALFPPDNKSSMVKSITLLLSQNSVRKMVAPIQISEGGTKHFNSEFGIMGAISKSFLDIDIIQTVASNDFFPEPAVTSILVNLTSKGKVTTVDRIMQNLLVDRKGQSPKISKIYDKLIALSKIYKTNKYSNPLVQSSFTSKRIQDKNIYELSNDQLSTLMQDLVRNDIRMKSRQNLPKYEHEISQMNDDSYEYEDKIEELERRHLKINKVKKAIEKYDYLYDDVLYKALARRGLEKLSEKEFKDLINGNKEDQISSENQ